MEKSLRNISKYCWYLIAILTVIFIYRKPHTGDYLYNVRTFSTKKAVREPDLQIIELKIYKNVDNYRFDEAGYSIYTSDDVGEARFKNSWQEDELYTNFAYYSFSEQKAYAAYIPEDILDELEETIIATKAKDRYFKAYYNIHSDGLIELNVEERSQKDHEEYSIYKKSYRATEIEATEKMLKEIEERIPVPLDRWNELINTKYNWGLTVNPYKGRHIGRINITTFTDDDYSYVRTGRGNNFTDNLKTPPQYINIWTEFEDGKRAGFEELKFDFSENKKAFDEVYKDKDPNDRSTITINLGRNGRIDDSITLSLDGIKIVLPHKNNY